MESRSNWFGMRDGPVCCAILLVFISALIVPADLLDKSELLTSLCRRMIWLMPFIGEFSNKSVWPQATAFVLSIAMLLVPIIIGPYLYWQLKVQDYSKITNNPKLKMGGWIILLLLPAPFLMGGPNPHDSLQVEAIDKIIVTSRVALGIFAAMMMYTYTFILAWSVIWTRAIFYK